MSTKTVVIWLVIAAVLGGGAVWYVKSREQATAGLKAGERVCEFDPAKVVEIQIGFTQHPSQILVKDGAGEWWLQPAADKSRAASQESWMLAPVHTRNFLRLLSTMPALATPPEAEELGEASSSVMLRFHDGSSMTLAFGERTLGGQGLVVAERAPVAPGSQPASASTRARAMVADENHRLVRYPAALLWRETTVFPGLEAGPSRVRLERGDTSLALGRLDNQWSVREPLSAPANPSAVENLVRTIKALTITDFLDVGNPAPVRPAVADIEKAAVAKLVIERDVVEEAPAGVGHSGGTLRKTVTQKVTFGGLADPSGKRVFAVVGEAPRVVAVDATGLGQLSVDAAAYLLPTVTGTDPANVGSLLMAPFAAPAGSPGASLQRRAGQFKRSATGWTETRADGSDQGVTTEEAGAINDFLTFLRTQAATATTLQAPAGYTGAGQVSLLSLSGEPLDTLEVGTTGPQQFVVKNGTVYRAFPGESMPAIMKRVMGSAIKSAQEGAAPVKSTEPIK